MIGALIGAGLSVASSIAGGIANAKARKKQREMLESQLKENKAWYDRKYNEDPTKRADTVRLLTQMQEQISNRNKAAKGRQAVMGGTEDSTTAVKEANNKTLSDTTSQIVAANESRKDSIEQQYQQNKRSIQGQQASMETEDAANTANTVAGIAGTAANIASALDSGSGKGRADGTGGGTGGSGDNGSNATEPAGATYDPNAKYVFHSDLDGNTRDQYGHNYGKAPKF